MQRYFAKDKVENTFILEPLDYHHIKHVMRMQENEQIEIVFKGILYLACVKNIIGDVFIELLKEIDKEQQSEVQKTICIPYLKEQKLDFILQKATELGVDEILLVPLERSIIKAKEEKEDRKLERWMRIVKEASEQSKRLYIPKIVPLKEVTVLQKLEGLKLICIAQRECKSIKKVMKMNHECAKINIVIGPEGGFSPREEEIFLQMGFIPVHLGKRVLRTETVPLYLLSILNYELME